MHGRQISMANKSSNSGDLPFMFESIFCKSLSCIADLPAPPCPAEVVVTLLVVAEVVVVFWEGSAAAVTGRGCVGVSVEPALVPGED